MLITNRICCILIAFALSATTLFSANQEPIEEDHHTNKGVGRSCDYLIVGKSEAQDQFIVTTTACGLLGLNIINAFNALTTVELTAGFLGGYFTADLASGITHMALDNLDVNFGPKILKTMSKSFQDHHLEPWRMGKDSFWFQNGKLYTVAVFSFIGAFISGYLGYDFTSYILTTTMGWNMLTQLAHACAHGKFKKGADT